MGVATVSASHCSPFVVAGVVPRPAPDPDLLVMVALPPGAQRLGRERKP